MKIRLCSLACMIPVAMASISSADVIEMNLGRFQFNGGVEDYTYEGDHADVLGTDYEGDPYVRTVATVDLGSLFSQLDMSSISWIRISDMGDNYYNPNNDPGADVDLFALSGQPSDIITTYEYDGPNPRYASSTSGQIASEVAVVDMDYGGGDAAPWWISLGENGSITMWLDGWTSDDSDGPGDGDGSGDGDGPGDGDDSDGGGDPGDGGDPSDDGDGRDPTWSILAALKSGTKPIDGGGITLPSYDLSGFQLRINEVSPTPEWVDISIGYETAGSTVVPGPAMLSVVVAAAGLVRRRRR